MDDNILDLVNKIRSDSESNTFEYVKAKYQEFFEKYPVLFKNAVDASFPLTYLEWMISMSKKVTESNVENLDKEVYDQLRKDYIDPIIKDE